MIDFTLTFSDAAKFADMARNLVNGQGFNSSFSFAGGPPVILPFTPVSIAFFFKIFGINDFAVIINSLFYYLLTVLLSLLLAWNLTKNKIVSVGTALVVAFDLNILTYAFNGASESAFIFEIVAAFYFMSLKKKWATIISMVFGVLMYLTRPQAFIYLSGLILFKLLLEYKVKKALIIFVFAASAFLIFDFAVLSKIPENPFVYSLITRSKGVSQIAAGSMGSDILRTGMYAENSGIITTLFKKVFYDLYNFYKALPAVMNPYLFVLFAVPLFLVTPTNLLRSYKYSVVYCLMVTLLVTAAGIPAYRYIHPVVPLVYIISVAFLYDLIIKLKAVGNKNSIVFTFLILFFTIGQSLGNFLLDSRFKSKIYNLQQPHVYKILSEKLFLVPEDAVVLTNLDTWGSWYGNRKTVWFSNKPQEITENGKIDEYDALYLTGYLKDDANYYMGREWMQIFENPTDKSMWTCEGCDIIAEQFELKEIFEIKSSENFEKMDTRSILLTRIK